MAIIYLVAGILFLLIAFILFANSLKQGEKNKSVNRKMENSLFVRSLISMVVGLGFIFLYIISKSIGAK